MIKFTPGLLLGLAYTLVLPGKTKNPPQPTSFKYSALIPGTELASYFQLTVTLTLLMVSVTINWLKPSEEYKARAATADKRNATLAAKRAANGSATTAS